jgi:DNA-binding response OmpR family regulator
MGYDTNQILIVEDDPDTALLTSLVLETEGYSTKILPSGEEALDFLDTDGACVCLVLLDLKLKGALNGLDVCRAMRADARTAGLPVVFFSANSDPENRKLAREAGGQGFLAKPFGYEQLLKEVDRAIKVPTDHPSPLVS